MDSMLVDYGAVLLLGAMFGAGELISVFRDAPTRALFTGPALFYVFINAAAGAVALFLTPIFGWTTGGTNGSDESVRVMQVLVAGLGAMALFRSSWTIKAGERDVSISPSVVLDRLLNAARTAVDRERAVSIDSAVLKIMSDVSFVKAQAALPSYCFGLLQSASLADQTDVARQATALAAVGIDPRVKSLLLGTVLLKVVGEGVLKQAVKSLGDTILNGPTTAPIAPTVSIVPPATIMPPATTPPAVSTSPTSTTPGAGAPTAP